MRIDTHEAGSRADTLRPFPLRISRLEAARRLERGAINTRSSRKPGSRGASWPLHPERTLKTNKER